MSDFNLSELKFDDLTAEDVEARVGAVTQKGFSILLYKDARVDIKQLDSKVGCDNWKVDRYERIGDVLFCFVSIWDENKKQWITKGDCGIESKQQDDNKYKAESSDAFKRACYKWGIGIKLYNFKNIFIPCNTVKKGDKYQIPPEYGFLEVTSIGYDDMKVVFTNKYKQITWQKGIVTETEKTTYKKNTTYQTHISKDIVDIAENINEVKKQSVSDDVINELLLNNDSGYTLQQVKKYYDAKNWSYNGKPISINFVENAIKNRWIK